MKIATTEINMGSQQGWYRMGQEVLLVAPQDCWTSVVQYTGRYFLATAWLPT